MEYTFFVKETGAVSLKVHDPQGRVVREIPRVMRMTEACRALKRSRRHLYRYVTRGWLKPAAKFSGEFFFDWRDLRPLAHGAGRPRRAALPARMAPLFPEYELPTLEPGKDADTILSRILERGSRRDILWAIGRYPLARRRQFLRRQGKRLLSERAFHFWSWLWMGVPRGAGAASWRASGRSWGGVS